SAPGSTPVGRFGADQQPGQAGSPAVVPVNAAPLFYAPVDYDGANDGATPPYSPSSKLTLPSAAAGSPAAAWACFPSYLTAGGTPGGYGSYAAGEMVNHPSAFNYFQPYGLISPTPNED